MWRGSFWLISGSCSSAKNCLAALAHFPISSSWGAFCLEVQGIALSLGRHANCWEKSGSSGWMDKFSLRCFREWCSQAEALYHHILGLFWKLQYGQARAMLRWSQPTWLHVTAFWENSRVHKGNWHWYQERVSGPWRDKYVLGRLTTTVGMDFKGKTSSAVVRLLISGMVIEVFFTTSGVSSSVVNSLLESSADSDSEESTWQKYPCKITKREDVSLPAKAIFILPKPSHLSWAAFSSRWAASSNKFKPWKEKKRNSMDIIKINRAGKNQHKKKSRWIMKNWKVRNYPC